jgi:hypothetical protein
MRLQDHLGRDAVARVLHRARHSSSLTCREQFSLRGAVAPHVKVGCAPLATVCVGVGAEAAPQYCRDPGGADCGTGWGE